MKRQFSIVLVCAFLIVAASSVWADHHAVKVAKKDGIGDYLTDAKGMTLYWFKKDAMHQSACAGDCLEKWPIYYRETVAAGSGLDAGDFGTFKRDDGRMQTTFRGYPLYYFFKDQTAGDTAGQAVKEVWFVIDPGNFPPK